MHRSLPTVFLAGLLVLATSLPLSAAQSAKAKKAARPASDCTGAWTGVITYTRTQTMGENKTTDRVSGRGKDTRKWEMKYDYRASVSIAESPQKDGSEVAMANITHSFTSNETATAVERNSCDRGKTWQDMTGTFTSQTVTSGSGREPASVHIGLNSDGTYAVSVGLPQIQGTTTGSESSSYSGQCSPKEGKTRTMEPMPTTIQGNSLTSDGSHRVDPENPNQLSGSYSASFANVTETITWNLQRCGAPLRLVELKFEDMKFPNWDDWQELDEQTGTVDGNWVRIKATVFNASGESKTGEVYLKETYKGDKWNSGYPDVPLKDQTFTVTLGPGEQKEVEMLWDSRGYAWFDDGRPRLVQRIKAEVWENFKKVDELTRNLKVRPRPVIIVGGVSTTPGTFEVYQNLLTTTHSYDWKAQEVVDTSAHGTIAGEGTARPTLNNASIYAHADNLTTYADGIRRSLNAWHVDMIGHSTGGLVARLYVHKQMEVLPDMYPVVKHLMLMGTPNNGMSCTDPIPFGDAFRDQEQLAKAVSPEEMAIFNRHVTQRKGTKFSALVGEIVPVLCGSPQWSDGFVAAESAKHGIEDVTVTTSLHNALGDTENFANYVRAHIITGPDGTYPFAGQGEAGGK